MSIINTPATDDTTPTTITNSDDLTPVNKSLGVLNWHQVNKLDSLLDKTLSIHGRGTYPTLTVRLKDFIRNLNKRLVEQRVRVRDIRINGGVASYVLAHQDDYEFSDIDIIFSCDLLQLNEPFNMDLSPEMAFANCCDIIKQTVFECLLDYFPNRDNKINAQHLKDAYVKKMVKIYQQSSSNTTESETESAESMQSSSRWSLIALCNNQGQNIELKFVDKMKRQFQFSVDAFQIHLASLLKYYDLSSHETMNENIYPTVVAESMYGEFNEANYHLNEKLIATKSPEEIRGGGLLKYCNLLVRGYKPVIGAESQMNTMEKYMCSRFFIDFSDLGDQEHKLNAYLECHFQNAPKMCVLYLNKLYQVVNSSTVCLMGHERKQTLNLIESLAKRYKQQQQSDEYNNNNNTEQFDNDSESVGSDRDSSSSLSSSSSSLSQHYQQQRTYNKYNCRFNKTPTSAASSPSSSSSIFYDSNYGRSPPNDYYNNSNQMYYVNYSKFNHNKQPQVVIANKLAIPFSSSSSLSSSSSSVVSSPSPSPPLTATPTTNTNTNIPFYVTISTPTPQEDDDLYEYNETSITNTTASTQATTPTSVFQCKIPTQYYPYIEVFNYYSPPVITSTPAGSTTANVSAGSPVYFYNNPSGQDNSFNNIITRIMPSKSYQYYCNDFNYMSSMQHQQQLQQNTERTDLIVQ